MPKSTCAILATFTSSEHGLTSACRVWSAKSPRPLWTPRTARRVHIPTLRGATSRLRSTWCKPDLQQTLDATNEKRMTLSQTYRSALIAGFLLTAVFHTGAAAQARSPQLEANLEYTR